MGRGCWLGRNRPAAVSPLGISLFAGDPEAPRAEAAGRRPSRRTVFPVPPEEGWRRRMQLHYGKRAQPVTVMPFARIPAGFARASLPLGRHCRRAGLVPCPPAMQRRGRRLVHGSSPNSGARRNTPGRGLELWPAAGRQSCIRRLLLPSIPRASRSRLTPGLASGAGAMPPSVPPADSRMPFPGPVSQLGCGKPGLQGPGGKAGVPFFPCVSRVPAISFGE